MTEDAAQKDEPAVWTIARVLSWAASDFRSRGSESPRLDAEVLLANALGTDRVRLITDSQRPLTAEELASFKEMIRRRRTAEPVAYILGHREFWGASYRVNRHVLVPRPDTETLVEVALDRTRARSMFGSLLDLCTGSGCVAIAFARERPTWRVSASDVSADALNVAVENAIRNGVSHVINFREGDLFAAVAGEARFDAITANPPYIPSDELRQLAADVRDHEPLLALDGGASGLETLRRIVRDAPRYLARNGVLALEVGHDQARRVAEGFARAGYTDVELRKDYGGHERVVSGRWKGSGGDAG